MRPIRLLILLLAIALALVLALLRPLQSRAWRAPVRTRMIAAPVAKLAPPPLRRHLMSEPAGDGRLAFGHRIVSYAKHFLGVPYSWGGSSPRTGFDCSGLVRYVYAHFGIALPHSSYADLGRGHRVPRRWLQPGDVVFFAGASHVGIYAGGGRFIDAPHSGAVVQITTMRQGWYGASYYGARRFRG